MMPALALLFACSSNGVGPAPRAPSGELTARRAAPDERPVAAQPPEGMAPVPDVVTVSVHALGPGAAGDGAGGTVQSGDVVAVDLLGAFGGRALDPVLHLGQARFPGYEHPAPGVLRFRIADRAWLADRPARLVYGDEPPVALDRALDRALDEAAQ